MCGIAGFAGSGSRRDIETMTRALTHRGPDGEGLYADASAPVWLGHRRLAIVDILGGQQPMWSADGQTGIVFNGEIYNHAELRAHLAGRRPLFPDRSLRYRGSDPWLSRVGRRSAGAPQRHVCLCDLRPDLQTPFPCARPLWREATVLCASPGIFRLRQRTDRARPAPQRRSQPGFARAAEILRLRLSPGATCDPERSAQTARRPLAHLRSRERQADDPALLAFRDRAG